MPDSTLQATLKGELPHLESGKRKPVQIRLSPSDHAELTKAAKSEDRSMSFIAFRRYQAGLALEQSEQP